MKKLLLVVVLMLCLVGTARANEPNTPVLVIPQVQGFTIWGGSEGTAGSALDVRVGYELKNGFEPGVGFRYLTGNPEWGPVPDIITPYLAYHLKEVALVADDLPDNAWEEILHTLKMRPYGIGGVGIPRERIEGEGRRPRLDVAVGTIFANDPTFAVGFYVEYGLGDLAGTQDQVWKVGARIRF